MIKIFENQAGNWIWFISDNQPIKWVCISQWFYVYCIFTIRAAYGLSKTFSVLAPQWWWHWLKLLTLPSASQRSKQFDDSCWMITGLYKALVCPGPQLLLLLISLYINLPSHDLLFAAGWWAALLWCSYKSFLSCKSYREQMWESLQVKHHHWR